MNSLKLKSFSDLRICDFVEGKWLVSEVTKSSTEQLKEWRLSSNIVPLKQVFKSYQERPKDNRLLVISIWTVIYMSVEEWWSESHRTKGKAADLLLEKAQQVQVEDTLPLTEMDREALEQRYRERYVEDINNLSE